MPEVKRLKVLILDDDETSKEFVVSCAVSKHEEVWKEEAIYWANQLIEVRWCQYVSQAKNEFIRFGPDVVFVDLEIRNELETDPKVLEHKLQGLYFIKWMRKDRFSTVPIKIHSKHSHQLNIKKELNQYGIGLPDNFPLDAVEIKNEDLPSEFPLILQQLAKEYFKNNAKAAETRGDILYFLNKGIKQDKLNDPIKSMNHFSVRSILAGWWYLEVNDDQEVIIRWKDSPEKVLQELTTTEGASAPPDKHWIHGIMVHPDFSSILDAAQAHAENVVESFVTIWQKTTLEQLPEQTEKLTHSIPVIQDAPHHLEIIDKVPLDDKHQREHHIKTLTLRLVVVGIYKARHKFEPCVREKILNCALLGCIRNKPDEMLDIKRKKSQVAQYLSKLNLSKEKKIGRKEEHLDSKVLYDFEKNWPAKIR